MNNNKRNEDQISSEEDVRRMQGDQVQQESLHQVSVKPQAQAKTKVQHH